MAVPFKITNKTTNIKTMDGYIGKKIALKKESIPEMTVMPKQEEVETVNVDQPVPTMFNPINKAEIVINNDVNSSELAPASIEPVMSQEQQTAIETFQPLTASIEPVVPQEQQTTIETFQPLTTPIEGMPVFDNEPVAAPEPILPPQPTVSAFEPEPLEQIPTPIAVQPSTETYNQQQSMPDEDLKESEMLEALLSVRDSLDMTKSYVEGLINKYSKANQEEEVMRKVA